MIKQETIVRILLESEGEGITYNGSWDKKPLILRNQYHEVADKIIAYIGEIKTEFPSDTEIDELFTYNGIYGSEYNKYKREGAKVIREIIRSKYDQ